MSYMWVRIRKGQLQGKKLVAKDVKYKVNLEKILKSDIGYIDFKNIYTSPDYLQQNRFFFFCNDPTIVAANIFHHIYKCRALLGSISGCHF
jgi:hypothetical protein